jgi:hypothetical protein
LLNNPLVYWPFSLVPASQKKLDAVIAFHIYFPCLGLENKKNKQKKEHIMKQQIRLLLAITMSVALCQASNATTLSGLVEASTDASGNSDHDFVWSTQGNHSVVDIFVVGSSNLNGSFVNGPSDSLAAISISLTPGIHTYSMFGGGGFINEPYDGLNIYFNGNTSTPGISVFGPVPTTNNSPSFFSANGGSATGGFNLQTVAGANSIIYSDGANQVTLTSYSWDIPSVNNLDRVTQPNVGYSSVGPDGNPDWVGQFTLNVVAVPEPGTGGLMAAGSLALLVQWFRFKKYPKNS